MSPRVPARLVLALVAGATLGGARPAGASPVLQVLGRARIELERMERVPGGIEVSGRYVDADLGTPIVDHSVAIDVRPADEATHGFFNYAEPTKADGRFRWTVPLPTGRYHLRLGAGGDVLFAPAEPIERDLDLSKRTPRLTLRVPATVSTGSPLRVEVELADPEGAAAGEPERPHHVDVSVGTHRAALDLVRGRAETTVRLDDQPGTPIAVEARFEGDLLLDAAREQATVRVTGPTTLTLAATSLGPDGELDGDDPLDLEARLTSARGAVPGATIVLALAGADGQPSGAPLVEGVTDELGRARLAVRGGALPRGLGWLVARYAPAGGAWEPSTSALVPLVVRAPRRAVLPFLVPPLLTAFGAAAWAAARRRRDKKSGAAPAPRKRAPSAPAPAVAVVERRTGLLAGLRGAHDHVVSGRVVDAIDGRGLPGALVRALGPDGELARVEADPEGQFELASLPAGAVTLEVEAPGYVPERFTRALPHRGELRGLAVRLVSVRARVFAVWRRAVGPLFANWEATPTAAARGHATPRETLGRAQKAQLLVDELAALTELVEEACFGPRTPGLEVLAEAEARARRTQAEADGV